MYADMPASLKRQRDSKRTTSLGQFPEDLACHLLPTELEMTLVQAVTDALACEMRLDDRVIILGEDVGLNGGVFRATEGLQAEFGADRVVDSPLG